MNQPTGIGGRVGKSSSMKTARIPRKRGSISLEAAVDAALVIIDAEGLDALSIRRLAGHLGVGAMTLYTYFENKDQLLDQVAVRVLGKIRERVPAHGTWQSRLTRTMKRLHVAMREHPGVGALSLSRHGPIAALDPFRESILAILCDAGFPIRDAVNALTALVTYVIGYTIVELARTDARIDQERARLAALPKNEFPNLAAAADHYASQFSQRAFDSGLRSLIDGLAAELAALPRNRSGI